MSKKSNYRTINMEDRANSLISGVRQSLNRMDHTLTLAEAKIALMRDLMAKRREKENPNPPR